jgi:hypothetical protein
MGISSDAEIQQVFNRLLGPMRRDGSAANQTTEHVKYLNIEKVRSMQRFRM